MEINPAIINCEGCLSDNVFKACDDCLVRNCGQERGVVNCGHCSEYACNTLSYLYQKVLDHRDSNVMKGRLDKERSILTKKSKKPKKLKNLEKR